MLEIVTGDQFESVYGKSQIQIKMNLAKLNPDVKHLDELPLTCALTEPGYSCETGVLYKDAYLVDITQEEIKGLYICCEPCARKALDTGMTTYPALVPFNEFVDARSGARREVHLRDLLGLAAKGQHPKAFEEVQAVRERKTLSRSQLLEILMRPRFADTLQGVSIGKYPKDVMESLAPRLNAFDAVRSAWSALEKELLKADVNLEKRSELTEEQRLTLPSYVEYTEKLRAFLVLMGTPEAKVTESIEKMAEPYPPINLFVVRLHLAGRGHEDPWGFLLLDEPHAKSAARLIKPELDARLEMLIPDLAEMDRMPPAKRPRRYDSVRQEVKNGSMTPFEIFNKRFMRTERWMHMDENAALRAELAQRTSLTKESLGSRLAARLKEQAAQKKTDK